MAIQHKKPLRAVTGLVVMVLSSALALSANAACKDSDRPLAPGENLGESQGPTSIRVSFRNSSLYYDVNVTEGENGPRVTGFSGITPPSYRKGMSGGYVDAGHKRAYFDVFDLKPNTKYCVQIWTRTKGGTEGCTSKTSAVVCPTTAALPAPPTPAQPAPPKVILRLPPSIAVAWSGQVILVRGSFFTPGAPVTIDVAGAPTKPNPRSITVDILGALIVADAKGSFARRIDACNNRLQGDLTYSARDKDRGPSKSVTLRCRTGFNPAEVKVPPSKVKP